MCVCGCVYVGRRVDVWMWVSTDGYVYVGVDGWMCRCGCRRVGVWVSTGGYVYVGVDGCVWV